MTRTKGYEVRDRQGHIVDRDDDELLRDGERLRVPMQFRDSMSPVQRAIAEDAIKRKRGTHYDPRGFVTGTYTEVIEEEEAKDAAALLSALDTMLSDAVRIKDEARQEMIDTQANAWRNQPGADPFERALAKREAVAAFAAAWKGKPEADPSTDARDAAMREMRDAWKGDRDAQPGDVCTVREGASLYGWREGSPGHLQMVGGKLLCVPDKQQDSAPTTRDEAWEQLQREKAEAWRTTD